MNKLGKLALLCALMLSVSIIPAFADGNPCDGQVPIGTKCLVQLPDNTDESKSDTKTENVFDWILSYIKSIY